MSKNANILTTIVDRKQQEVVERSRTMALCDLVRLTKETPATRGFVQALKIRIEQQQSAVIAEVKKASPSKGVICHDFDPVRIAKSYQDNSAACLSVLTDMDFFQGCDEYFRQVRQSVSLPMLRKDFMVDVYQIYESRALGADCILLIAACLTNTQLFEFSYLAAELGMDVLVEVHNLEELERALQLKLPMIGINNRNLKTFETSLSTTIDLLSHIPEGTLVITESGIHTQQDIKLMHQHQVYGFLVGEAFMKEAEPGAKLKQLFFI